MNRIIHGDCLQVLKGLQEGSIDCCVTSPPYWGLRDYGNDGQIGLERTPEEYTSRMVAVFREVRRVLKPQGTLWLNLGDCYATGAGKVGACPGGGAQGEGWAKRGAMTSPNRLPLPGLKPKDLVGIPWRVAFALQADGWYLRQDIIWHKPNPMPESVRDRCTKAHEYFFLLSKQEKYYFDCEVIKQDAKYQEKRNGRAGRYSDAARLGGGDRTSPTGEADRDLTKSHKRSVWTVTTKPFKGAHFATFPPDLIEPCILAGCPEGGVVLDPFFGAGTTGLVSHRLGRNYLGVELNPDYISMANERIGKVENKEWLDI